MYLNIPKEVTNAALLSLMRIGTQEMYEVFEVKGEAAEALAFKAPLLLAPSPHMLKR